MTDYEEKILAEAKKIRSELYDIGQCLVFLAVIAVLLYLRGCK